MPSCCFVEILICFCRTIMLEWMKWWCVPMRSTSQWTNDPGLFWLRPAYQTHQTPAIKLESRCVTLPGHAFTLGAVRMKDKTTGQRGFSYSRKDMVKIKSFLSIYDPNLFVVSGVKYLNHHGNVNVVYQQATTKCICIKFTALQHCHSCIKWV